MKTLLIKAIYHFLFCIYYIISSSDSDDDTNEQYLEQVARNGKMFDEIILVVARTTVYYHNNFLVKEPCRNLLIHDGNLLWRYLMAMIDVAMKCFGWKSMYFANYVID